MSDAWDAEPGYRTRDLTNDQAWDAMQVATNRMIRESLAARKSLLDLGFAADHSLCKELDEVARHFSDTHQAIHHQRQPKSDPAEGPDHE